MPARPPSSAAHRSITSRAIAFRRKAKWLRHAVVVGLCKLAMLWAIMPALAEASVNTTETSESVKTGCVASFECTVERLRRLPGSNLRLVGKQLHPTRLTLSSHEHAMPLAQAEGHRLSNGLCAPRLC